MTTRIERDVPENQKNFVIASMRDDSATVTTEQQDDGRWTITGVFPERRGGAGASPARHAEASRPSPAPRVAPPSAVGGRASAVDTLARTIWGEARGEPRLGKEAVAAVVLNRVRRNRPERFGGTIEEVCRKPKQFSCWNPEDPNRAKLEQVDRSDAAFQECLEVAERAVVGALGDPTEGSDHYHTVDVAPDWSRGKTPVKTIGRHRFFNSIA